MLFPYSGFNLNFEISNSFRIARTRLKTFDELGRLTSVARAGPALAEYTIVARVYGPLRRAAVYVERDARQVVRGEADMKEDSADEDGRREFAPARAREEPVPAVEG